MRRGGGTPKDEAKAADWYEKAAQQGYPNGQLGYGNMYYAGKGGLPKDRAKAFYWYELGKPGREVSQDSSPARRCAITAKERLPTKPGALYWYEQAAQQGDVNGQFYCSVLYSTGKRRLGEKREAQKKAQYWHDQCLRNSTAGDRFRFAGIYQSGRDANLGVEKDLSKALYWYEQAAQKGHVPSVFQCGWMYLRGEGTAIDKLKAFQYFDEAARAGDLEAQLQCGVMYLQGDGVRRDREKGKDLLRGVAFGTDQTKAEEMLNRETRKIARDILYDLN